MKILAISFFICFSIFGVAISQTDTIEFKRWEIGAEYNWDHLFYNYEWVKISHSYSGPKRVNRLDETFRNIPYANISYGLYINYKILRFLSVNAKIDYKQFRLLLDNEYKSYWIRYNGTESYPFFWDYSIQSIEFPILLNVSFFNNYFINPYILVGITNNICVFEQALLFEHGYGFHKNKNLKYYSNRFNLGAGLDIRIKKCLVIGTEAYFTSRPNWLSDKTMVAGVRYSNFSIGIHAGYLFK